VLSISQQVPLASKPAYACFAGFYRVFLDWTEFDLAACFNMWGIVGD
jgi:hypothetical protein